MSGKVEIKVTGNGSSISFDGTDISTMCVAAEIKLRAGELPQVSIERAAPENMLFVVEHDGYHSDELIKAATAILRMELMKHGDLYNGYLASIESALKEKIDSTELWHNDIFIDSEEWAKAVMNRIIGEG